MTKAELGIQESEVEKEGDSMKTCKWAVMMAMAAAALWAGAARAGSLDPTNGPGPTMHTLEEIYQNQATLAANQAALEARLAAIEQRMAADGMAPTVDGMVLIPAGAFRMGDGFGEGAAAERPVHTVTVSAFYMDQYEVTKAQWDEVRAWALTNGYTFGNAGSGKEPSHPVHTVNWYDAVAWCNARSQRAGLTPCYTNANGAAYTNSAVALTGNCNWTAGGYRLPTEAEWEKAARGGVAGRRFPWADVNTIDFYRANYYGAPSSYSYDTSFANSYHPAFNDGTTPYTSPVGSFAPNGYGLFDIAGNLWEWCWDWRSDSYYASSPGANPTGPAGPLSLRVLRGGSWDNNAQAERVAGRQGGVTPDYETNYIGFRCARGL